MSYNSLYYDNCTYNQRLSESEGPGLYKMETPGNVDKICLSDDPYIRPQYMGSKHMPGSHLIDVDSELMNITRPLSVCPSEKYIPHSNSNNFCNAPNTHNKNVTDTLPNANTEKFKNQEHMNFSNCFKPTESTRLSNPPTTLRGTGFNRWEWMCNNPQEKVEVPFDHLIDSVLMAKDNHRPLLPKPMDQTNALPVPNNDTICETLQSSPEVPTGPPSINWKTSHNYGY